MNVLSSLPSAKVRVTYPLRVDATENQPTATGLSSGCRSSCVSVTDPGSLCKHGKTVGSKRRIDLPGQVENRGEKGTIGGSADNNEISVLPDGEPDGCGVLRIELEEHIALFVEACVRPAGVS